MRLTGSSVRAALLVALGPLTLAGCGAGDPTYYRVSPVSGTPTLAASGLLVAVPAPTVAGYLDRDFIVTSVSDYRLHLAGNDAWAEPVADMIGRTLAADLAQRLPGSHVLGANDNGGGRTPDARIDLDIGRFDRDASGTVLLRGTLTVRGTNGAPSRSEPLDLSVADAGAGTAAFVAAESRLLGQVADRAAALVATTPPPLPSPVPLASADPTG